MAFVVKRSIVVIFLIVIFFVFFLALLGYGTSAYFSQFLTTKDQILNKNNTGLTLLDDQGQPFFTFFEAKRGKYVILSDISKFAGEAAVSTEDKDFYKHNGFSLKAIARSFFLDIQNKGLAFGGSTITQQLVKNSLLSPSKNIIRKFQEVILAREIENRYTKDQILEMYLNSAYFGEGAFGIDEAANVYFDHDARDLSLSEASYLIGLLPSPTTLSPYTGDRQKAKDRQKIVLDEMKKQGYITDNEAKLAYSQALVFKRNPDDINNIAPHFAIAVRDQLIKQYGEETVVRSGFQVKTTLNRQWQEIAQNVVKKDVASLAGNGATNGAVVVMDPVSGEVKVMVGSVDWDNEKFGKVNMALSPRQPGSSFKPIVYGLAFNEGLITTTSILPDVASTFKIPDCSFNCLYSPRDYDGKFRGNVTVRRALANSLNVPAVHLIKRVGVEPTISKGKDLGITTFRDDINYGLSLVLGAAEIPLIEMTNVYASFANSGEYVHYKYYTQIIDKNGKNIYRDQTEKREEWTPQTAFLISSILSDNKARAEEFGNLLTISRPTAVKTGTSETYRDAWTLGYTPDLTIGVWVGNNDNRPMDNVAGSLGAAPIWRELMETFNKGKPVKNFVMPEGIVLAPICNSQASASASGNLDYFVEGTQSSRCNFFPTGNVSGSTQAGLNITPTLSRQKELSPTVSSPPPSPLPSVSR